MTLWSRWLCYLTFALPSLCYGQTENIFSYENSFQYAQYLLKTHQYTTAFNELDRMIAAYPDKDTLKEIYIDASYTSSRYKQGEEKVQEWYINANKIMPYSMAVRYNYLLIEQNSFHQLKAYADTGNVFNPEQKLQLRFSSALLLENWQHADTLISSMQQADNREENYSLLNEGRNLKYKSPFKAAVYSALIPGTGKMYAGDAKDGVYSFLAVMIPAVSAYRGFTRRGTESIYGWANLGLASFMYTGNIYGAVRSARQYNKNKKENYRAKVKSNIYSLY